MPKKIIIHDEKTINRLLTEFARTTDDVFSLEELKKILTSGKRLVLKYGVDVTAPHLHIGHAVNLWMYRSLQELGHKIIFLIGDFTTQIGDPTGKNKTRPVIPEEEIKENAEAFIKQAMMVLHNDPDLVEIRRNSEWFREMPTQKFLSLMSMVTHAQLAARDMFRKRIDSGQEIYMHEMIYPLLQGYDSVELNADLTIIGSDQLYNEMMGRFFQEKFGQTAQVILTTKITPGIDGKAKQSKSLGNYIGLSHSPREKFGRLMSMPDNLIQQYLEVYTDLPMEIVTSLSEQIKSDPMKIKTRLANAVVSRYHGNEIANTEERWFIQTFSRKEVPTDIPTIAIGKESAPALEILKHCQTDKSNGELRRLIEQGGAKVNGEKISSPEQKISLPAVVTIGKRHWFDVTQ